MSKTIDSININNNFKSIITSAYGRCFNFFKWWDQQGDYYYHRLDVQLFNFTSLPEHCVLTVEIPYQLVDGNNKSFLSEELITFDTLRIYNTDKTDYIEATPTVDTLYKPISYGLWTFYLTKDSNNNYIVYIIDESTYAGINTNTATEKYKTTNVYLNAKSYNPTWDSSNGYSITGRNYANGTITAGNGSASANANNCHDYAATSPFLQLEYYYPLAITAVRNSNKYFSTTRAYLHSRIYDYSTNIGSASLNWMIYGNERASSATTHQGIGLVEILWVRVF